VSATSDTSRLLKVCKLLNEAGAKYLVAGAYAMILNDAIRATQDVDILIEESVENFERVIAGLSRLADGAAAELTPQDFLENVVIKIADEVEVDVSTRAWTVSYAEAIANAQRLILDGIEVPYLSMKDLIRSKETYRDQDRIDVEWLHRLQRGKRF
jgi:hypothetical protein